MTQRIYDLQARISADGTLALAVRDLITLPSGKRIEGDPRPVQAGDAAVVAFVETFNAAALADAVAKTARVAELEQQLATMTTDRNRLASELAAAEDAADAKDAAIGKLIAEAGAAAEAHAAAVAALESTIDQLRNPPRVPTILLPAEFLARFTDAELDGIQLASDNAIARKAARTLFTQLEVNLESPKLAELMAGLVATNFLTAERAAAIIAVKE